MSIGHNALVIVAAWLLSAATVLAVLRWRLHGVLDQPNGRSLHRQPVPRSGGLGILAAAALGFAAAGNLWLMMGCAFALAAISALDDQIDLPVWVRLPAHFAVVVAFWLVSDFDTGWLLALVAIVAIAWMTNLYNFMDGSDGLAGGMALFGFSAFAYGAAQGGDAQLATACAAIAAGAAGFLLFNFHPARIFMGDVGSIPLGFLAAAIGAEGVRRGLWPLWFVPLVFSPFIVDASVTLARRALRGERVWQAHREHCYQRMVLSGLGHRNTALIWYGLMGAAGVAACALLGAASSAAAPVLGFWVLLYLLLVYLVDARCRSDGRTCTKC